MRNWINLVEAITQSNVNYFLEKAKKYDSVEAFIKGTDGDDVLYRGHRDEVTGNNVFMTDYVGHAEAYADDDGRVDAFIYDPSDVLVFNDDRFDEMRGFYRRLEDAEFTQAYRDALEGNRFAAYLLDDFEQVREIVIGKDFEYSDDDDADYEEDAEIPYSQISRDYSTNDMLVPLMQKYAWDQHGKNIIAFTGNDYADYGGQNEYVVRDVSLLVDLRKLYMRAKGN